MVWLLAMPAPIDAPGGPLHSQMLPRLTYDRLAGPVCGPPGATGAGAGVNPVDGPGAGDPADGVRPAEAVPPPELPGLADAAWRAGAAEDAAAPVDGAAGVPAAVAAAPGATAPPEGAAAGVPGAAADAEPSEVGVPAGCSCATDAAPGAGPWALRSSLLARPPQAAKTSITSRARLTAKRPGRRVGLLPWSHPV